jgi:hypothetical protein
VQAYHTSLAPSGAAQAVASGFHCSEFRLDDACQQDV